MEKADIIFQSVFFHFPKCIFLKCIFSKCILQSEFESGLVDQAGITRPGGLRATHRADLFALKMESHFSVLIMPLKMEKKLSVLIIFHGNYAKNSKTQESLLETFVLFSFNYGWGFHGSQHEHNKNKLTSKFIVIFTQVTYLFGLEIES